jgi:hypothetical protein
MPIDGLYVCLNFLYSALVVYRCHRKEKEPMQHYPTLGFSQFRVVESVPSHIRLPAELDTLLTVRRSTQSKRVGLMDSPLPSLLIQSPLPTPPDFSLEKKVRASRDRHNGYLPVLTMPAFLHR